MTVTNLQTWFATQCNGDWEHGSGIRISTLDNPGWAVDIDLRGTPMEGRPFVPVKVERSDSNWLHASSDGMAFKGRCSPTNLAECLKVFLDWAGA